MDQGKSIVSLYCAGMSVPDINMKLGVPKSTIYYQIKKFEKTGSTDKVPGQGRKRTARSKANVDKVKARIRKDPFVSQRQLAWELQIAKGSIQNLMKKDLDVKSRARVKKHLINQVSKEKRLQKGKKLVNLLKTKKLGLQRLGVRCLEGLPMTSSECGVSVIIHQVSLAHDVAEVHQDHLQQVPAPSGGSGCQQQGPY
jgi:transposase